VRAKIIIIMPYARFLSSALDRNRSGVWFCYIFGWCA